MGFVWIRIGEILGLQGFGESKQSGLTFGADLII